uniref:Uncharacterized protein n=1 Tax=Meloidogyne enterolobii TaxID=390850 RepID=A0A6V7TR88_MELEN|nr:unnamed protein product [Meloidogyne enterolobii]
MFYSLPTETKLDIFKCLNYNQLCLVKQTNLYFRDFINNFDGKLAREELKSISFFKNGLEKPIPLYLPDQDSNKNCVIHLYSVQSSELIFLQLPTIIKSKNDVKIVYYYLNKLFNCSFEFGKIHEFIFNPELIKLLFGTPKRIYIKICGLAIKDCNIENILQFTSNNLASESFRNCFYLDEDIMEKYVEILFKILINGGDNFETVDLDFDRTSETLIYFKNVTLLYEHIVEYIATSRDCSKMVSVIFLSYRPINLQLTKRAEKVEIKQRTDEKFTKYQIANIYNPKVRFSFSITEEKSKWTYIYIRKV